MPTSVFNLPDDPVKGEGTINVGLPKVIESGFLKHLSPPVRMNPIDFAALVATIRECLIPSPVMT